MDYIVGMRLTTHKESGSRFGVGDTVYASVDCQRIKQFKVIGIMKKHTRGLKFEIDSMPEIWYQLEPTQFLPENRVFKTEFECRNDLIKRFNGI